MVGYSKEWLQHMITLEVESGVDVCIGPPVEACAFCDGNAVEIYRGRIWHFQCQDCGCEYADGDQVDRNCANFRASKAASRLAIDALNARDADIKRWYT